MDDLFQEIVIGIFRTPQGVGPPYKKAYRDFIGVWVTTQDNPRRRSNLQKRCSKGLCVEDTLRKQGIPVQRSI